MLSLRDLQIQFKDAVFDSTQIAAGKKNRFQVYCNNILITLTEALQSLYPTIYALVGEDFFVGLAREYVARYPSNTGDLHDYGNRFAEFLADFTPAQTLVYLPEVAQLEWAYHEVFHEVDVAAFDLNRLKVIAAQDYGRIRFKLNPASRLFAFEFPVLQIWQACQEKTHDETITLNEGGEKVLVLRRQQEVFFEKLTASEFALLAACSKNELFEDVCAAALACEPTVAIDVCLQRHLSQGTITDYFF